MECSRPGAQALPLWLSTAARVDLMPIPPRPTARETTEAMVRNICRELSEIERAMERCRGEASAEPKLTGTWMAYLLLCSKELLHNLLIDTAPRPRRLAPPRGAQLGLSDCAEPLQEPG